MFEQYYARATMLMTGCNEGWEESLKQMGICAYHGAVPPSAISRVSYIDFSKMSHYQELDVLDIGMSVTAYQANSRKYNMIEDWFFGGSVTFGYGVVPDKELRRMPGFEQHRKAFEKA